MIDVPPTGDDADLRVYVARCATAIPAPPVLVLLHGARHAAMSFALLVRQLRTVLTVVAYDARGHGGSPLPASCDCTAAALARDCARVCAWAVRVLAPPAVVLGGHSLGGAIACRAAEAWPHAAPLAGLVLLDVVEGVAQAALPASAAALARTPASFPSLEDAVEWAASTGAVRLRASAALSLAYALARVGGAAGVGSHEWRWRAAEFMSISRPSWHEWFEGTTARFLSFRGPRLLVLSGVGALDTPLTVALMQGRFELAVVAEAGHALHEDCPDRVAAIVVAWLRRAGLAATPEREALGARLARAARDKADLAARTARPAS